jgi:hypothetical protein
MNRRVHQEWTVYQNMMTSRHYTKLYNIIHAAKDLQGLLVMQSHASFVSLLCRYIALWLFHYCSVVRLDKNCSCVVRETSPIVGAPTVLSSLCLSSLLSSSLFLLFFSFFFSFLFSFFSRAQIFTDFRHVAEFAARPRSVLRNSSKNCSTTRFLD